LQRQTVGGQDRAQIGELCRPRARRAAPAPPWCRSSGSGRERSDYAKTPPRAGPADADHRRNSRRREQGVRSSTRG
jgi:hypothetical protein